MKKIIIMGTGGNCIDILDTILEINDARGATVYECVGFLDDDEKRCSQSIHGVPVLGPLTSAHEYADCCFVSGIGSPATFQWKRDIIGKTGLPLDRFETIVHPTASVSRMSRLGHGVVILQNVTVASGALIGNHVIILPNTVVSHDDVIGDYSCVAASVCISGRVHIGASCYLGANSAIRNDVRLGDCCLIGMGSVVLADVAENSVMVGNPARFLRKTLEST